MDLEPQTQDVSQNVEDSEVNDPQAGPEVPIENSETRAVLLERAKLERDAAKKKALPMDPIDKLPSKIAFFETKLNAAKTQDQKDQFLKKIADLRRLERLVQAVESLERPEQVTPDMLEASRKKKQEELDDILSMNGLEDEKALFDQLEEHKATQDEEVLAVLGELRKAAQLVKEIAELTKQLGEGTVINIEPVAAPKLVSEVASELPTPASHAPEVVVHLPPSQDDEKTPEKRDEKHIDLGGIKQWIEVLLNYPSCAERSLDLLIAYSLWLQRYPAEPFTFGQAHDIPSAIDIEFANLEQRLKLERLDSRANMQIFNDARAYIRSGSWGDFSTNLMAMLREIRPFDIREMLRLWGISKQAADRLAGKDIILFLGETGAGKSTTIHFLAGSDMREVDVDPRIPNCKCIRPVKVRNRDLDPVKVAASKATSETRFVSAVEVKFSDLDILEPGSFFLCDTPGFGDTAGPEVDVANGLGLVNALVRCRSVKPIVLSSSKDSGGKAQGLKRISYRMASLVEGVQHYLSAFSYSFVRYAPNDNPLADLNDLKRRLASPEGAIEAADEIYKSVLDDMIGKTNADPIKIDLLGGKPAAQALIQQLRKTPAIKSPAGVFKFTAQEESRQAMRKQLANISSAITNALERQEFGFVLMKLDELKDFCVLEHGFVDEAYQQACGKVGDSLKEIYRQCHGVLSRGFKDQNELTQDDLEVYDSTILILQQAKSIRSSHIPNSEDWSEALRKSVEEQVSQLADVRDLTSSATASRIRKLKTIAGTHPDIGGALFQSVKRTVHDSISEQRSRAEKIAANLLQVNPAQTPSVEGEKKEQGNHFDEFAALIQRVNSISRNFAAILEPNHTQVPSPIGFELLDWFLAELQTFSCARDQNLQGRFVSVADLKHIATVLEEARACIALTSQMTTTMLSRLDRTLASFFAKLITGGELPGGGWCFITFKQQIDDELKKPDASISELGKLVLEIDKIRSTSHKVKYNPELDEQYRFLVARVQGYISQSMQLVKKFLDNITSDWDAERYRRLPALFAELKQASWIDVVNDGAHEGEYKRILEMNEAPVVEYVSTLKEESMALRLDNADESTFDNVALRKVGENLAKVKKIATVLSKEVPKLATVDAEFEKWVLDTVTPQLEVVRKAVNLGDKKEAQESKYKQDLQKLIQLKERCDQLHQHRRLLEGRGFADITEVEAKIEALGKDREAKRVEFEGRLEDQKTALEEYQLMQSQAMQKKGAAKIKFLESKGHSESEIKDQVEGLKVQIRETDKLSATTLQSLSDEIVALENLCLEWQTLFREPNKSQEAMKELNRGGFVDFTALEQATRLQRQLISDASPTDISFSIDPHFLESILQYVNVCGEIPVLAPEVARLQGYLKKELQEYSELIWTQVESCLSALLIDSRTISSQRGDEATMKTGQSKSAKIKMLHDRLIELRVLSKNDGLAKWFPREFRMNLLATSLQRVKSYYLEVKENLSTFNLKQAGELHAYLVHVRLLQPLDDLFHPDDVKFDGLFEIYNKKIFAKVDDLSWLQTCIEMHDYAKIESNMQALSGKPVFEESFQDAKQRLSNYVSKYLREVVDGALPVGSHLEVKQIQIILGELRNVGEARRWVHNYLEEKTQQELDEMGVRAQLAVQDNIKNAAVFVEASIRANNFVEAEQRYTLLIQVLSTLRGFSLPPELASRVHGIEKYLAYRFRLLNDYYAGNPPSPLEKLEHELLSPEALKLKEAEDMQTNKAMVGLDFKANPTPAAYDFSRYRLLPPLELFAGLDRIIKSPYCRDVYENAQTELRGLIDRRFRNAINSLNEMKPKGRSIIAQKQELDSALRSLPPSIGDNLKSELTKSLQDIDSAEAERRKLIAESVRNGNLQEIEAQFQEFTATGMEGFKSELENKVVEKSIEVQKDIVRGLSSDELSTALSGLKTLSEYKSHLPIPKLKTQFSMLSNQVAQFFEKNVESILGVVASGLGTIQAQERVKLETQFENVVAFDMLLGKADSPVVGDLMLCTELLPKTFALRLEALASAMAKYFDEFAREMGTALANLDPRGLQRVLDISRSWEPFVKKVVHNDFAAYPEMKSIMEMVKGLKLSFAASSQIVTEIKDKMAAIKSCIEHRLDLHPAAQGFAADRDRFYREIEVSLRQLKRLKDDKSFELAREAESQYNEAKTHLDREVKAFSDRYADYLSRNVLTRQDSQDFSFLHNNLVSIQKNINDYANSIDSVLRSVNNKFVEKIDNIVNRKNFDANLLSSDLNELAALAVTVPMIEPRVMQAVDEMLVAFDKQIGNNDQMEKIQELATALGKTSHGEEIGRSHAYFQSCRDRTRVAATEQQTIEYVLQEMRGDQINKNELRNLFHAFIDNYNKSLGSILDLPPADRISRIVAEIVCAVAEAKDPVPQKPTPPPKTFTDRVVEFFIGSGPQNERKQEEMKTFEPQQISWTKARTASFPLLVHVFLLWTVQRSEKVLKRSNDKKWLPVPHPVQVVALLRLFGYGYSNTEVFRLPNTLHQILTGEGKSLVLGVAATIFALLGFSVSVACYSQYLSRRDYDDFLPIFDAVGVTEHVHYGTFNQLCEQILNQDGKLRDQVQAMIGGTPVEMSKTQNRPLILLLDEVDVFFSRDFRGSTYRPATEIKDPAPDKPVISNLITHLWETRSKSLTLQQAQKSSQYQSCVAYFSDWKELIDEALKNMLVDLKDFDGPTHKYLVDHDRICYVDQDGLSDQMAIRYKTMFAYFLEKERGNISEASWQSQLKLVFACGSFSYSEIAKYFDRMMGLTGTLENISPGQMAAIEKDFNISRKTLLPSAYGKSKRQFFTNTDTDVVPTRDYFLRISDVIDRKLMEDKRAVLVCFEDIKSLTEYWDSDAFLKFRSKAQKMTEEASGKEKVHIVALATRAGQVTLMTRSFGRGTDFYVGDPVVLANGGVHVLQVFVSEDRSEEIQICGRAARQGQPGSYSMTLSEDSLETFFGPNLETAVKEMESEGKVYDRIDAARNRAFEMRQKVDKGGSASRYHLHMLSMQFLVDLRNNNTLGARAFLCKINKGAAQGEKGVSRTVVLLDATGSMSQLLNAAKNTVQTMFTRVCKVLEKSPQDFEMQFCVYRNYNCDEALLLQHSPWSCQANELEAFLSPIKVAGGLGHEAIEIGLAHVNRELERVPVTQVIIIGDAAPNTPEEVKTKREIKGESYWATTKYFAKSTTTDVELKALVAKGIPVHTFYVHAQAKEEFEKIATQSNGKSSYLDVNSDSGAQLLTDEVCQQVLRDVAGGAQDKAQEYVDTYIKLYRG